MENKKSFVIFVCPFDEFNKNQYVYRFRNMCKLDDGTYLELGDETEKIFLNTKGKIGDISESFIALLDYIDHGSVSDSYTEELEKEVNSIRNNEKWRLEYMTLELKLQEERLAEREETMRLVASNLLKMDKLDLEDIAKITGFSIKELEEMKEEIFCEV